jgi:hypothetical protein
MSANPRLNDRSIFVRYGFFWACLVLFLGSTAGQWTFGWRNFSREQRDQGKTPHFAEFVDEGLTNTFENWQAEFMSVLFQILGLSILYAVGSPQSRDSEDRTEHKLDLILRAVDPENADKEIKRLDRDYARK